jgi:hypothetical protein
VEPREKRLWNAVIAKSMAKPIVKYDDVMRGDRGLAEWLEKIVRP